MEENIRSLRSTERAFVRFINKTERCVDVIWINFTGRYVKHHLGAKGNFIDVNTYKSHPWIAVDTQTKDRLHIERDYTYFPKTTKEYYSEKYPNRELPFNFEARIRARITLPVYSLKQTALLEIRNRLSSVEQVNMLDLPRELKENLRVLLLSKDRGRI